MTPRTIEKQSSEYPELLTSAPYAPDRIHLLGQIPTTGGLAIVGSRRPTAYGLRMARLLASEAARSGIATVSGLARGIDTEVHRATLDAGGITWAILGSGLGKIYPSENISLAEEIVVKGGALISEFDHEERPLPAYFPQRNRIISGLAWATVVVEGDLKSGALITAKAAAEQGREVLAVPGPADSRLSEGPLSLIKTGAAMVVGWKDVLDAVPVLAAKARSTEALLSEDAGQDDRRLAGDQRRIVTLLGSGETPLEELRERARLPMDRLAAVLLELEMVGLIRSCPGQRYAKT